MSGAPMTEKWRQKFAELRAARVAAGLCERCDKPARRDRVQCADCAARSVAAAMARYRAVTGAPPSRRKCRGCGVVGHDKRSCPTVASEVAR